jgi:hypothetical protein
MNETAPDNFKALKLSTAVGTAWRDVRDVLSVLFAPALIAFLILLALGIVRARVMPSTSPEPLENLGYEAVKAFLMTPYAIAVHRFIILGEKTSYRIAPAEPRFRRFFGWSLALSVLASVPGAIFVMLPGPTILQVIVVVILGIAVAVVGIRAIVLFPAVAVDAPSANWRQAMADTDGHAWKIIFIIVVAALPFLTVFGVAMAILRATVAGDAVMSLQDFLDASAPIVEFVGYTLAVVIASRLYQRIGVKVKGSG